MTERWKLPWLELGWQQLLSYRQQHRIPQALLIAGTKGIGKTTLADFFAASLLCLQPQTNGIACGRCRSCQLKAANSHPDFIKINPEDEKTSISVSQIRTIITDTYLKPQYESHRVVLINPADALTMSAANAFLKCLEEPPERTLFLLITNKPNKLPVTITSRCQRLNVVYPENTKLADWLGSQSSTNNPQTSLNLLKGSLLTVNQLHDEALLKQRDHCFDDWLGIARKTRQPAQVAEKWQTMQEELVLGWVISWLVDLIKCSFGINRNLVINFDKITSLEPLAGKLAKQPLFELYSDLLAKRDQLGKSLNFQIMTEEILVKWQRLNGVH